MSEWRSIDTAPKDGTRILVWEHGERMDVAHFDEGRWRRGPWWIGFCPSHWMPLPAEPDDLTASEKEQRR